MRKHRITKFLKSQKVIWKKESNLELFTEKACILKLRGKNFDSADSRKQLISFFRINARVQVSHGIIKHVKRLFFNLVIWMVKNNLYNLSVKMSRKKKAP